MSFESWNCETCGIKGFGGQERLDKHLDTKAHLTNAHRALFSEASRAMDSLRRFEKRHGLKHFRVEDRRDG